jgi:hypothetical protein
MQILYLDSADLGVWNLEHINLPRVRYFSGARLRAMILADSSKDPTNYSQRRFGKSKVSIRPTEHPYYILGRSYANLAFKGSRQGVSNYKTLKDVVTFTAETAYLCLLPLGLR